MIRFVSRRAVALMVFPLTLAACGEGYEMIRTDQMVPYGNTRTAGTGVAYALAQMMPEKELKLEPAVEPPAPPPAPEKAGPDAIKDFAPQFQKDQEK